MYTVKIKSAKSELPIKMFCSIDDAKNYANDLNKKIALEMLNYELSAIEPLVWNDNESLIGQSGKIFLIEKG